MAWPLGSLWLGVLVVSCAGFATKEAAQSIPGSVVCSDIHAFPASGRSSFLITSARVCYLKIPHLLHAKHVPVPLSHGLPPRPCFYACSSVLCNSAPLPHGARSPPPCFSSFGDRPLVLGLTGSPKVPSLKGKAWGEPFPATISLNLLCAQEEDAREALFILGYISSSLWAC